MKLRSIDDIWADDELHLGQPEVFRDLFDLVRFCTQLEDFLCAYLASLRHDFNRVQHDICAEMCRGRRPLTSDDCRCRTGEGRNTGGGGQTPCQEAQGVFCSDAMVFSRFFFFFFFFFLGGGGLLLQVYVLLASVSDECL